jgi:hypothetical protein
MNYILLNETCAVTARSRKRIVYWTRFKNAWQVPAARGCACCCSRRLCSATASPTPSRPPSASGTYIPYLTGVRISIELYSTIPWICGVRFACSTAAEDTGLIEVQDMSTSLLLGVGIGVLALVGYLNWTVARKWLGAEPHRSFSSLAYRPNNHPCCAAVSHGPSY